MARILLPVLVALSLLPAAHAGPVLLENRALRVAVDLDSGRIRVRDKVSGRLWDQPAGPDTAAVSLNLRHADGPRRDGAPIAIPSDLLGDARKVDGPRDCSGRAWLTWDETHLFLAADIEDDVLRFGPSPDPVWERDSLEVWIGARQILLALSPQGSAAYAQGTTRLEGGRIDLKTRPGGYSVEAALPWSWAGSDVRPKPGSALRVAVGINDADANTREGQLYWPRGWAHSEPATFARALLGDAQGAPPAAASSAAVPVYRVLGQTAATLDLERAFDVGGGKRLPLRLHLSLPAPNAPDLRVEAQADAQTPISDFRFLEPFVLDAPQGVLAVADYGDGHLYPLDAQPFPRGGFSGDRLDMPWVGLTDLQSGQGYLLLLETSDDASVSMQKVPARGGRPLVAPVVGWRGQKGVFGYPRRVLYHFAPKGGYVALCKRYREYARAQGLIVPFTEKLKKTPNLRRLFGAPDVWGDASLSFARAARAAGVEKMLIHGRPSTPADMRAINDLGYLTSEYDNYTDILPTEDGAVSSNRAHLPEDAVMQANGERMKAWLTFDKKTQFMKRCPSLWADAARSVADKVLAQWPFIGRFIDVTSAEGMYECYDPKHPLTRAGKRGCGPALYRAFRDRGLVMGGEHGIWWAVPYLDYIEGMQSGGYTSWPAGWLIHPKNKEEEFSTPQGGKFGKWEQYAKWGIGHEWRAPLWELVFHDCIVSTWYWGDASDFLLDAAPEVTPKKDAFNLLYGTIPLMWADGGGSWRKDRQVFLRTYRNTCKLHETLATAAMLSHEFVTPDHAVQRTRWSDGTVVTVNFGDRPWQADGDRETGDGRRAGRSPASRPPSPVLPRNGFLVTGPKVQQSLTLENGKEVTTLRAPGYTYTDRGGVPVTIRAEAPGRVRIMLDKPVPTLSLRPAEIGPNFRAAEARLYRLDERGETVDRVVTRMGPAGELRADLGGGAGSFLLVWGPGIRQPDLCVSPFVRQSPAREPRQGERVRVTAPIVNLGKPCAAPVPVALVIDGVEVSRSRVDLRGRNSAEFTGVVDTSTLDGPRTLEIVVDPENKLPELCKRNNRYRTVLLVRPDWARWEHRRLFRVEAGERGCTDGVVTIPLSLPQADPASVRVAAADAQGRPGEVAWADCDRQGRVSLLIPGSFAAGQSRRFLLLWSDSSANARRHSAPGGSFWHAETNSILTAAYEARFENGTLAFLAPRTGSLKGPSQAGFLKSLVFSSKETGWSDEPGTVERFEVEHQGPVRTVIHVRKALQAGVVYDKTYTFYPAHFEVEIAVNKPAGGLYSRAHYAEACTFVDDKGNKATVDGRGDGEGIYGANKDPKWYAVFTPRWAQACIALTPMESIAYWDAGLLGAVGFHAQGNQTSGIRMAYVLHPGAADASFAQADYQRLMNPPKVAWE